MITYKMLPLEEWYRLQPLFSALFPGLPLPKPELAKAAVAEANGEIVAFWFMQLCAHMEPAGVDPRYADIVSLHKIRNTLHLDLPDCEGMEYYIYTATPEWDEPLQKAGFRPIGLAYAAKVPSIEGIETVGVGVGEGN